MRRKRNIKRIIKSDYKWESPRIAKFINVIMYDGKKSVAERVVYDALELIGKKASVENPVPVFDLALDNIAPAVEVRSRRVGGANYQVPVEVRGPRRMTLTMRWLVQAARSRKGGSMAERLAEELIAATKNEGAAIKKKLDTHRMAEANKAFAHFAW
ncbi:MAG: 30S ribosomal protein S7 [Candidatus Ryanbacteria bacterium RIFCSPHIGHO2_02_FULL_45_17b]|uniref:Small ribosomal subunit protein uS7 n=1 Tax=Candidatus Ryanbacteria bacterium RIFCSPHIGHO2_01_FULL_45_22 TaxID=1802114 RepID=A0A1G2FYI3_9BACT|nr:MAG: 30S ribosomal protein S7 [Candidatus Ryanbacteria bacterium RIFCSPHIGHO2_01_FULL_45_22]OGZ46437.1 MAG: 30S ribosomal protein S7 [Candidatus Ryanbacteria bacterium RIFCSPHIGHO2_02_FULL_45_17b]